MDVDLLRPGTVPISPDTVLWFEFLLNEDLLRKHLQKPSCDPSPTDLINTFFNAILESIKNEVKLPMELENGDQLGAIETYINPESKSSLKKFALKILSLKVAAHLKWNLNVLKTLPFKTQLSIFEDLLYFANNQIPVDVTNLPEYDSNNVSDAYLFALLVYHRWIIKTAMYGMRLNGHPKAAVNTGEITVEESILCSQENLSKSLSFLTNVLTWDSIPQLLTFDCFLMLKENSNEVQTDWTCAVPIPKEELQAQIHFDLGCFFFYKENYSLATIHFTQSRDMLRSLRDAVGFHTIEPEDLDGYIVACNGGETPKNLHQQLRISVTNHYKGTVTILQRDNIQKEIPICYRTILELDIQGATSSGKFTVARDLLSKIQALNTIRCILDQKAAFHCSPVTPKNVDTFLWALGSTWRSFSEEDRKIIKSFCLQMVLDHEIPDLLDKIRGNEVLNDMLDKRDVQFINKATVDIQIPECLKSSDWDMFEFTHKRNPKLEIKTIEQQIISSYNPKELTELLNKLSSRNLNKAIWKINPRWELPIPLQSVLTSLPRGFLQDFGFLMLAKSRELMLGKDWNSSLELLQILQTELQSASGSAVAKLSRLISWEMLLVQISKLLEEWPAPHLDKQNLADECEACLQTAESVLPRTEVMEQCVICLLNLGRWDFLVTFDKRWTFFEITAAIAQSCHDFMKYKGNKKVSKDIWDLVLPVFGCPPSMRRAGGAGMVHQDSPTSNTKLMLMSVLTQLRDSTALTMVISMLTRLYNVLRDESSLELQVDFLMLWPAVVSNANSYNTRAVCELLKQMVMQALYYYPTNIPWLRLMGDIHFANGHNESALNFYLKSLVISTDYFNLPVRSDDHVFRRMIKSCNALGNNTQAAALCQFLEEPDYVVAFHILAEQKQCNDAVDAYYHCFFDVNILEYLIYLHNKKGELQRRRRAVQVIGLLELNSNNNEEIQRETINLRKSTFLRALTKQYVH